MKNIAIVFLFLSLLACTESNTLSNKTPEEVAQVWTDETRSYIIKSHVSTSEENLNKFVATTIGGIGIDTTISLESENITTTAFVANDSSYIYIKKRRANGMLCFDGITINGALYGTAEWFNKNGYYKRIGYYYNNIPCGKWKYYSRSNDIDSIVDQGNESLLLKLGEVNQIKAMK